MGLLVQCADPQYLTTRLPHAVLLSMHTVRASSLLAVAAPLMEPRMQAWLRALWRSRPATG